MPLNGLWTDFIADFVELAEGIEGPPQFKLWSAISLVAGALERRVWTKTKFITYPSLYVLLVAPPGVGKFIIQTVREFWQGTRLPGTTDKAFKVAPNSMTKASLVDTLATAKRTRIVPVGDALTYHSLLIAAEEFGVLLPDYDNGYITTLCSIFSTPGEHSEVRRHGPAKEIFIPNPQLNIIGGYQPALMGTTFPEEAWSSGLGRRLIMIYASERPYQHLFYEPEGKDQLEERIRHRLGQMSQLYGPMQWRPEAATAVADFHFKQAETAPKHSKLLGYCNTRVEFVLKLIAVSTVARTGGLIIELEDVHRAIGWLLQAEKLMPDIFRAMVGKSDSQIIDELHYFVQTTWNRQKREPVQGALIREFLLKRAPHDKVESLLLAADRANIVARQANTDDWVPKPRHEHGVE